MDDYELLYYIYQQDEEALQMMLNKYHKMIYFTVKKVISSTNYICETNDELFEMIELANIELYQSVYSYRNDGKCTFSVFAAKCIEMCIKKYIRSKRSQANYMVTSAMRLDSKVEDESMIYLIDAIPSTSHEYEGQNILKWYYEENILDFLNSQLKEREVLVVKMMIEGYTQTEIAIFLKISYKQVSYIRSKLKNLLIRYID